MTNESDGQKATSNDLRTGYEARMTAMRARFDASGDGVEACQTRSAVVDDLLRTLWMREGADDGPGENLCLVALGGYGRGQLFPFSDIDLLFCGDRGSSTDRAKEGIRRISQTLWDCGLKVAPVTRTLGEVDRYKAADPEGSLALLDMRLLAGDAAVFSALRTKLVEKRSERDVRALTGAMAALSRERHARFGHTLFHLEPNIKDSPGGLRDAHVCDWLRQLVVEPAATPEDVPFHEGVAFLTATRVFLHLRHGRDDNTLDWHTQHEAATRAIGLGWPGGAERPAPDPAYWMRAYFRHARAVKRALDRELERSGEHEKPSRALLRVRAPGGSGMFTKDGVLHLKSPIQEFDPAEDPDIVLSAFGFAAETALRLAPGTEERIAAAIPALSASLEDGPRLWARLKTILTAPGASGALREMHALGVLELILPEFHGIDALVIRDAYHRYTVDEHTFVLLDVLHGLALEPPPGSPEWRLRFCSMLNELAYPELLYLAALLHDTGKGRTAANHAAASASLAAEVCARLELGPFESGLVTRLIDCHLEMSAALRRDIFDTESVRVFAEKVGSHDLLRMLTLFTYADISAVHPDALTPWKAENLWRLSMAAANQLDRSVDEDRVHAEGNQVDRAAEAVLQALGRSLPDRAAMAHFLEGFPERYLRTRTPESIRQHMLAATGSGAPRVLLNQVASVGELTVVAEDRRQLFADLTAALASWGLEVVTAEAFSNASGAVVDTFRFTDPFRTLELNPEERERFLKEFNAVVTIHEPGTRPREIRRSRREPPRRVVETKVHCDNTASSHSTLLQIVAQDVPGLLRTAALVLSDAGCSVEVALIDTEGEMAIDVFYITRNGHKLTAEETKVLCEDLVAGVKGNAV